MDRLLDWKNGAKCWFKIPGIGYFQPSEFVKIFMILVLANVLDRFNKEHRKNTFKNENEIEEIFEGKTTNIEEFFKDLKEKVNEYYKA